MFVERHERWVGYNREDLRKRFLDVVRARGYLRPEVIVAEYLDKYMQDMRAFDIMLQTYERGED